MEQGTLQVITVNPMHPRDDRLAAAIEFLLQGGVAAVPTETFYGLAVDSANAEALGKLNQLKRKDPSTPILLLMSERSQVSTVAGDVPAVFDELAELFWPGPLTLVVPASPSLPSSISGGLGTVAVRVPGLAVPRRLAAALGRPVTGISANLHREPPCRTAAEVAAAFPDGVDLILDGGPTRGGRSSTILDLTGERPCLLREGLLPASSLSAFLPDLVRCGSR
jgi:L-threonylcarbamoyladenylate synthase